METNDPPINKNELLNTKNRIKTINKHIKNDLDQLKKQSKILAALQILPEKQKTHKDLNNNENDKWWKHNPSGNDPIRKTEHYCIYADNDDAIPVCIYDLHSQIFWSANHDCLFDDEKYRIIQLFHNNKVYKAIIHSHVDKEKQSLLFQNLRDLKPIDDDPNIIFDEKIEQDLEEWKQENKIGKNTKNTKSKTNSTIETILSKKNASYKIRGSN